MATTLNVATKRIIKYQPSHYFSALNGGTETLHKILECLDIPYTKYDEYSPELDRQFEITKEGLRKGISLLKRIESGESVNGWLYDRNYQIEVDGETLNEYLDYANMNVHELIQCFEWLLENGEKSEDEFVFVSFL